MQNQSTGGAATYGASTHHGHQQNDIKSSLENQRQVNKQKFEEPYFIKIGEDKADGVKIVKVGQDSDDATSMGDISPMRAASGQGRINDNKRQPSANNMRPKIKTNIVVEAHEHEEQSPDPKKKGSAQRQSIRGVAGSSVSKPSQDPRRPSTRLNHQETVQEASEDGKTDDNDQNIPQLVSVDLNLDSLRSFLEEIQDTMGEHARSLISIQNDLKRKANEKTLGHYLQKISECLYKECGERPHAIRLDNESNFLQENFQSDESTLLKRQAEKMMEKMEVYLQSHMYFRWRSLALTLSISISSKPKAVRDLKRQRSNL